MTIDELIAHLGNMTTDQEGHEDWAKGIGDAMKAIEELKPALEAEQWQMEILRNKLSLACCELSLDVPLVEVLRLIDGKPNMVDRAIKELT